MRKISKGLSLFMVVLSVLVSSFFIDFQSDAANIYYSQFEEPTVNEYCGYINLEIDLTNGGPSCVTLAWSIIPTEIKNDATLLPTTMMNITVNQNNVVLNTVGNGQADCHVLVWELNASDQYLILKNSYPSSGSVSVTDAWNGTITGFSVYGNYGSISSYMGMYNPSCTVIWADEEIALNRLTQIYQAIVNTNNNLGGKLDSLVSKVGTLISEVDNVEETLASIKNLVNEYYPKFETELQNIVELLDALTEEQEESNSWLKKIYDKICEALGLVGEESTEDLQGKDEATEMDRQEEELLNDDSVNTDDLELNLDTNSSGTIWAMVDNLVTSNEKVFTALISVLTLGIVALILGR